MKQRLVIFHTPIQQSTRELWLWLAQCAAIPAWRDSSVALLLKHQHRHGLKLLCRGRAAFFFSMFDRALAPQSS